MLGVKKLLATGTAAAVMFGMTALPSFAMGYGNNGYWNNNNNYSNCNCNMQNSYYQSNNIFRQYQPMNYNNNYWQNQFYLNQMQPMIYWNNWYDKYMNGRMMRVYFVVMNNHTGHCWYDNNQWNYQWDN